MIDTSNNTITTTNALLYKIESGTVKFLLAQENDDNWGLPGGAKEVEDLDLLSAIKRELKEELGLEPQDYELRESGVLSCFS
jgi:8-oxo-dGTP pyrophosphatase MutT (NUDIX family)